ncbi:MAG: hypothetical protein JWP65_2938 [Ramlibacter sp.]|jgi:hypothetical protein|uniref:putative signal transducing protein n=1 Tax=Ramlibacter sp. TaxID=1917967 RepID=UPI002630DDE4|nr:DUF2007 domain-containing protein [Ramlibacter sp.]MDB5752517.1 hypothetical protein [Ramlibacter sp.]
MKRIAQAPNLAIAALWADTLREAGFSASVQRQFLSGIAGELPPDQCLPEIWLLHDQQEAGALALLQDLRNLPQRRWQCACGELVEGGFESCWNCGLAMPA